MTDPKKPGAGAKPADETPMLKIDGSGESTDASLDSAATMLGVRVPAEIDGVEAPDPALAGETMMLNRAAAPPPDVALDSAATMLGVRVPAEIDGVEVPDAALANETVMLKPNLPAQADATVNFDAGTHGASSEGEATAKRAPAAASKSSKRPLQDLVDDAEPPSKGTYKKPPPEHTMLGDKARTQNGMQMVVAGGLLLIALIGTAKFAFSRTATPSTMSLQLLYPFGIDGAVLPNGHRAPGVGAVTFTFAHADDCDGERCVTYDVSSSDLGFHYEMVLQKEGNVWKLLRSGPGRPPVKAAAKR